MTRSLVTVSRIPNSMEIWWTGADGSVQAAYWYEGGQWTRYQMVPSATFSGRITSGGLAALGGWAEATVYSDGTTRMRGHAHDSGADGYDFGVSAILTAPNARAVAFAHTGHVGGTFTSGSRDHDWDETYPAQALVRTQFPALAHGQFQLTTQYSSDFGSTVESVVSGIVPFLLGATPVGAVVGVVVFVGAEVGSLISTGSLVPGARLAGRVLWLAGPSNTLLALAAEGIASAGSRTRELTEEEYRWANDAVFSGTLPPRADLVLTDTIGGGNRAFTFPRFDGKITLNMGPDSFDDPRKYRTSDGSRLYGETFIHELVHAWQIAHTPMDAALLFDALLSKICEALGDNPYAYGPPGPPFSDFSIEEQAKMVADWYAGRVGSARDTNSPYFRYVNENIRTGQY